MAGHAGNDLPAAYNRNFKPHDLVEDSKVVAPSRLSMFTIRLIN